MGAGVDRLAGFVLDATLAAGTLLTLAALAMVACRQPVRRCGIARGALIASIALLPMVWLRPLPRLDVAGKLGRFAPPIDGRPNGADAVPGDADLARRVKAALDDPSRWAPRALTILYVAVVGANLAWLALNSWGAGRLARCSPDPSTEAMAAYRALLPGFRRRPKLRVAARARRPGLLGLVRPVIVIPPELDLPEARDQLRLSLLHELVHAERLDPWFGLVGGLAQAFWFFLPPLWWIRAQMRLDQEFLADRRASAGFGPFGTYAASLVDLADPGGASTGPGPGREASLGGSALFLRVLMLVRCPFPVEFRPPLWWRLALPPVLSAAALGTSALTLRESPARAEPPRIGAIGPEHGTFTLARLVIDEPRKGPDGRPRPYPLLIRTPPEFDLTLEIWADGAESLANLRVVGRSLGSPAPEPITSPVEAGFHPVRIHRDRGGVSVWVDGRKLPPERDPRRIPRWITVQTVAPQPIQLRNLKLVW